MAVIGDSILSFGITSLMDVVYNKGNCVTVILDNRTTGMTGHQENPGTGQTLMESRLWRQIFRCCVKPSASRKRIFPLSTVDLKETNEALSRALEKDEPTVIIAAWPCAIKKFSEEDKARFDLSPKKCIIDQENAHACLRKDRMSSHIVR